MPKPSGITTWATDPGATADPGPARRASGFVAGKKLPAKWLNWLLAQNGAWLTYLRDLHIEPEFLNKVYAWTGAHGFSGPTLGFFQNPVLGGTNNEILYGDALGVAMPRTRSVLIPQTAFVPETVDSAPSWAYYRGANAGVGPGWVNVAGGPTATLMGMFPIPSGARLLSVSCHVQITLIIGSGPVLSMDAGYFGAPTDGGLVGYYTRAGAGQTRSDTGILTIDTSAVAVNAGAGIDSNTRLGYVEFQVNGGAAATINWVRATFADPGPRNY